MKGWVFFILMSFATTLEAQRYGRAQGFPADPVISLHYQAPYLLLGTQGSGVYYWDGTRILPAPNYSEYQHEAVYGFTVKGEPVLEGDPIGYPLKFENESGIRFRVTEGALTVTYADEAIRYSSDPSQIWNVAALNVVRTGATVTVFSEEGKTLNKKVVRGLVFDVAETYLGLMMSTEGGIFVWENGWKLRYSDGLPVFRFENDTAITPMGSIALEKFFSKKWSISDFGSVKMKEPSGLHSQAFAQSTLGSALLSFTPFGVEVWKDSVKQYVIDERRGLPALEPGKYSSGIWSDTLWIATPKGLFAVAKKGAPEPVKNVQVSLFENGLEVKSFNELDVEPSTLGFVVHTKKVGSAPVYVRYRLNGEEWLETNIGAPVVFERPAFGKYYLEIQTSTYANFDLAINTEFSFVVRAPWYKRPWSWAVVVLVVAAGIIGFQRRNQRMIEEKLHLQERLADAELASKRLQMNPHFLFNALDAISNFIFKNQPKDAVRYMGKLAKLMRLTLDSSRSDSMVVADEVELLQQYLDLCILRYGDFETKIEVCEGLDPYDEVVPPMLIQPLVENAVQHAVRPLLSAQKPAFVHIQFSLDETAVVVKVRDNGKGYDAKSVRSESHGLEIIKERLELLSKKHGRPFELNVKSPWDHSSSGTEVSLILNMESNG